MKKESQTVLSEINNAIYPYIKNLKWNNLLHFDSRIAVEDCLNYVVPLLKLSISNEIQEVSTIGERYSNEISNVFSFKMKFESKEYIGFISAFLKFNDFSNSFEIDRIELTDLLTEKEIEEKAKEMIMKNPSLAYQQLFLNKSYF